MNSAKLRPIESMWAVLITGVVLFGVGPIVFKDNGILGTYVGQIIMLIVAFSIPIIRRASLREVFPVKKIHIRTLLGSLIMWASVMAIAIILMMVFMCFNPESMDKANDIKNMADNMNFKVSILTIAVMPAICEEILFRGTILAGFRNSMPKMLVIMFVGLVFGAFHGSYIRFIPTCILGMLFSYILIMTDNILYTIFLHFINNLIPVFIMKKVLVNYGAETVNSSNALNMAMPIYCFFAGIAVFVFTLGNVLMYQGEGKIKGSMFSYKTKGKFIRAFLLGSIFIVIGILLLGQ